MIGQQACFHSAMKYKNDVSKMVGCLQVVRIYNFMKVIKLYTRTLYIVFFFVKTDNNNFYKRNKTYSPCLHSPVKTLAKFVRILEQVKCVSGFH